MFVSSTGNGIASQAMQGGEALAANLAKNAQELEGQAALQLLASTAQLQLASPSVGSTGGLIGTTINITA
ncbi:hypothetical protein [Psychrosphaera aestuarii]|uniref:hypothetical protein n=1 Tax=Psychrosphaera aestuarii TaxID=1266052 RepID=UPI001B32E73C|nr:hypothetical protein [Psychrosphaera aestuarii]